MTKSALIAGSTGLVGNELLQVLLQKDYDKIYALVRKPLKIKHPKLVEVICDFDQLDNMEAHFAVNHVYCCLGTTIKKAKSKGEMVKVDVDYPYMMAKLAKKQKVEHFVIISSMNANARSKLFYPRIKGLLEDKLKTLSLTSLSIIRPSLLLGERQEKRRGERAGIKLYQLLSPFLSDDKKNKFAVEAKNVAIAMAVIPEKEVNGVTIYTSEEIAAIVNNHRGNQSITT